jgi:hypothetical protein
MHDVIDIRNTGFSFKKSLAVSIAENLICFVCMNVVRIYAVVAQYWNFAVFWKGFQNNFQYSHWLGMDWVT